MIKRHASKIAGALFAAAILAVPAMAQDNLATWTKYKDITINTKASGANVGANVTNFPVLVRLDSLNANDVFTGALAGGADIRFAKAGGAQRPFEIEHWDAVAKKAAIWVLVDTVKGNDSVTALRLYWGKSNATSASSASAVYDTANGYVSNWHLGNAAGKSDRPNGVSGAPVAVMRNYLDGYSPVPGVAGMADTVFGDLGDSTAATGRYIDMRSTGFNGFSDFSTGFTFSTWVRPTALNQFVRVIEMLEDSTKVIANVSPTRFVFFLNHSSTLNGASIRWGSQTAYNGLTGSIPPGAWKHLTVAHPGGGSAAPAVIYLDGDSVASTSNYTTLANVARPYVRMGRSFSTDNFFNGSFDEVSIAKTRRSAAWAKLTFQTQKPAANAVILGTTQTQTVAANPYTGWQGHRTIKMNTTAAGANIPTLVRNFPVLVRLGSAESSILSAANSNGSDIRFSKMNDSTPLPYQIESWGPTAATIWVKLDSIKGNDSAQGFRMHWDNDTATSQSSGPAVFDTTNGFVAVWHLNEASGNVADATGKGNTGNVSTSAPTHLAAGLMGPAKTFNGTDNWYQIGTDKTALNLNTNNGPLTITAWVNPTSCDARIAAFSKYSNSNDIPGRQYALHTANTATNWRFTVGAPAMNGAGDAEFFADAIDACQPGNWRHIAGTYASAGTPTADSAVNVKIYVDGVLAASGATASITGTSLGDSSWTYIGRISTNERYMNGSLDEITVSTVRRDSSWIKLAYESQKLYQAFTNIGVTPATAPTAPQGAFALTGTTLGTIDVNWTAPASNGGRPITGYTATATPGNATCTTAGFTCTITGLTPGASYTIGVTATNSVGTGASASAGTAIAMGISVPNAFSIRMDGARNPYTYRLPATMLAVTEKLTMTITDVQGKTVWTRTITPSAAVNEITWDGKSSKGIEVSSGMYMVRLRAVMAGQVIESQHRGVKF